MASKKYTLLLGMVALLSGNAFSQSVYTYLGYDSSVIPAKRMPQQNEFLNNQYAFPAKPRNQWEIGIKGGYSSIAGDVSAIGFTPGFGVHVRKAFGYVFSLRLEYVYLTAKGLNWLDAINYGSGKAYGNPWAKNYNGPVWALSGLGGIAGTSPYGIGFYSSKTGLPVSPNDLNPSSPTHIDRVFYNYKSNIQDLSLEGVFTLNNIRFHKAKTGLNLYGFAGIGATIYDTKVNALNGSTPYDFTSIQNGTYKTRKQIRSALKNLLDGSYESPAESEGDRRPKLFGNTLKPSGTAGAGIAYRLSKRLNLALETRWTFVKDDLLDGQRWQESPLGDAAQTRDFDSYQFTSLGLNINIGGKSVEPLWWLNPLDYAYNELNAPRHMKIPKPVLDDDDGDGVVNQFDREPNTPAGCPVDTHGVSRDTDGDGVPDCKDKELITPTQCQPVDADGVGKCPEPECCKPKPEPVKTCSEKLGDLPSVAFTGRVTKLSTDATAALAVVAAKLKANPDCNISVTGYGTTKADQKLGYERANAVKNYLVEKEGISEGRIQVISGQEGDPKTVDIKSL
jgi:outer membrane protein OmpA-like peptidoglycan-associated protein